jgi:hypothetical protein
MPPVQFDNQDVDFNRFRINAEVSRGIIGWLVKKKIVNSEKTAAALVAVLCTICVLVLILTIKFSNGNDAGIVKQMPVDIVPINDQQIP